MIIFMRSLIFPHYSDHWVCPPEELLQMDEHLTSSQVSVALQVPYFRAGSRICKRGGRVADITRK